MSKGHDLWGSGDLVSCLLTGLSSVQRWTPGQTRVGSFQRWMDLRLKYSEPPSMKLEKLRFPERTKGPLPTKRKLLDFLSFFSFSLYLYL